MKKYAKETALLLKDNDAGVRKAAIKAIAEMKAKAYANDIVPFLKDDEANSRGIAAIALVELDNKDKIPKYVVKDIKSLLTGNDPLAKRAEAALNALGVPREEIEKVKQGK